nr:hypothetical protein [Agrobacterium sp. 33MFTa1.1]
MAVDIGLTRLVIMVTIFEFRRQPAVEQEIRIDRRRDPIGVIRLPDNARDGFFRFWAASGRLMLRERFFLLPGRMNKSMEKMTLAMFPPILIARYAMRL